MSIGVLELPVEGETLRRLGLLGFERLEQLRVLSIEDLTLQFGREGRVIWERCRGIERTAAEPEVRVEVLEARFEVEEVGGGWLEELFGRMRDRGELCVQMVVAMLTPTLDSLDSAEFCSDWEEFATNARGSMPRARSKELAREQKAQKMRGRESGLASKDLVVNFSRPTGDARKASRVFFERMAGHVFEEVEEIRVVISRTVKERAEQLSIFASEKGAVVRAMETKGPTALMEVVWDDPKCRLYERRARLRSLLCEGVERPLCLPRKLEGEVAEVVNRWEVEEDWWTRRPIRRSYCLVWFANGTPGRVFCDRTTGKWFSAMS